MKTIHLIIGILAVVVVRQPAAAQDLSAYYSKMDSVFYYVDRSSVSSGLLADYGIAFVDFTAFDGVPSDTNYVTITNKIFIFKLHQS
jgi:hypothetical protein